MRFFCNCIYILQRIWYLFFFISIYIVRANCFLIKYLSKKYRYLLPVKTPMSKALELFTNGLNLDNTCAFWCLRQKRIPALAIKGMFTSRKNGDEFEILLRERPNLRFILCMIQVHLHLCNCLLIPVFIDAHCIHTNYFSLCSNCVPPTNMHVLWMLIG